ncbi:MAG: hypothetical protein RRX95_06345 [Oscillospiraceae bacterium]
MKKLRFLLPIILLIFMCGCADDPREKMVKAVSVNRCEGGYKLSVFCYDFKGQKEDSYTQTDVIGQEIEALFTGTLNREYNLKLCRYCFAGEDIIKTQSNSLFRAVNNSKFPSNINIVCADVLLGDMANFALDACDENPLYNLKVVNGRVTGSFPLTDNKGKLTSEIIISNGGFVYEISKEEWGIIQLLTGRANTLDLVFFEGECRAMLKDISISFGKEKQALKVKINATLDNYRGRPSDKNSRDLFVNLLKIELANQVCLMYGDVSMCEVKNLKWYEKQIGETLKEVKVTVNIV